MTRAAADGQLGELDCGSRSKLTSRRISGTMIERFDDMTRDGRPAADLGPRQARFVEEYLVDLNAKQAAIRAGYSPRTAEVQGSRLLSHVKVQRAVTARTAERSKRTEVAADRALLDIARIGFSDLRRQLVLDRTQGSLSCDQALPRGGPNSP